MEALRGSSFLWLRGILGRGEIKSLPLSSSPNHHFKDVSFSLSITLPQKIIQPSFLVSSLSSSNTQVDVENKEVQSKETERRDYADQVKTVHVKFQLGRKCSFGQQFLLVGEDPMLGLWDPEYAIPLNWSEGHVWTVELDIPIGKSIKFKFIMAEGSEEILWQPGPDRILETWETEKTIAICEDWDNAEFQTIKEEEPTSNEIEDSITNLETLVAENVAVPTITEEPPTTTTTPDVIVMPFTEDPKVIVAEDINEAKEKSQVNTNNTKNNGPTAISKKKGGFVFGNNDRAVSEKDSSSKKVDKGSLVSYVGEPVLVPGLTPLPTTHAGEESVKKEASVADVAKELKLPEVNA